MTQSRGRGGANPAARIPELLVSIGCSVVAFTGVWLWWFGEDIAGRVIRRNDWTDPFAAQFWMRRLHSFGSYGLGAVLVFMVMRAAIRRQGLRIVFLVTFLGFLGIGVWAGITADWEPARLWSETIGTKLRTGFALGEGPRFPDELRRVRLHLSIVPAALAIVAMASFLHYRRR
jgi:hypothetical protein